MTVATAPKAAKLRPNLTSVTPAPPPPAPPEVDTTTPIDVSVIAFTHRDMPKWGAWMLYRLQQHWQAFSTLTYAGTLAQYMENNHNLFIRSRKAILLAVVGRDPLDPRPVVDIVFCFKHVPDDSEQDKDVRLLFRRCEAWAKGHGARYVRVLHPERLDCDYSRAKETLWADDARVLLKDLDK